MTTLKFPRIESVALRHFSLYTANPNATFECGDGVLCLVGANGIGKSTLLSAINFCLTGIVPDPNRSFVSMEEYYKFTRAYSSGYFRGRIDGNDQENAEITVRFTLGPISYEVRRGLFEPEELRGLTILQASQELVAIPDDMPRGERHRLYTSNFVTHSGLSSFEEFVFLQHFVFTFDEQRKTLFWNQGVLERVLYRAFGLEPNMAKKADSLRREIDHEDSKVRNYQFEATRMRRRINEILSTAQAASGAQLKFDTLTEEHKALSARFADEGKQLRDLQDALNDTNLRLAEEAVRETALRQEYAMLFDDRFELRPPLSQHPLITASIQDHACGLCGANTDAAITVIRQKSQAATCPLCDSHIEDRPSPVTDDTRLREIDMELANSKRAMRDAHKTLERLRKDLSSAQERFDKTKGQLDEFDRDNATLLDTLRHRLGRGSDDATLSAHREQLTILEAEKQSAYTRREELKTQLQNLQNTLAEQYLIAEGSFVRRFAELAQRFLGMPLTVQLDARQASGLNLVVTVRGSTRRQQQQLSESQRFFLDIALRMALTQHMSDQSARGGMFIDTPEGSLDIAYEKRAGDMLAMFSAAGHQVIMTANLNSSRLLLELAHRCGRAGMTLCRMTDWAELSQVQQEEESLFEDAYRDIENAMGA